MNRINLKVGEQITSSDKHYIITHIIDLETVLCKDVKTQESCRLWIRDLSPLITDKDEKFSGEGFSEKELVLVTDEDWHEAQRRFNIIRPLLECSRRTGAMVAERARVMGVHATTIYRWIKIYESTGTVSSLITGKRNGGRGKARIQSEIELIIQATIEEYFLTKQRHSVQKTCNEVISRCRNAKLVAPHSSTIRRRIAQVSEKVKLKRRVSSKAAYEQYSPKISNLTGADWPLSTVQIDHTLLDIILVDDIFRLPIARPWITLAIDVFSRMVAGIYVSFDKPSALSVGLCIVHAILPKEKWLAKLNIATKWPLWGMMRRIHVDNAKEFRGDMLKRACQEHGIDLEWRPLKRPQYGGHIERLLGTFLKEIHSLPGTTFSNPQKKGEYNSEGSAAITLREFEEWLANYITGVYHQRVHNSLKTSPLKQYEKGIFGTEEIPGTGLPSIIVDEERLRLDFMPYVERTIQPYGVIIDRIHYYSDVLRRYINATLPDNSRRKRKFIFKRDSRDISVVYFYDPDLKQYSSIPYRNISYPPISIWELQKITKRLEEDGKTNIDEDLIFETYKRMREVEEKAVKESKVARLTKQRRSLHQQAIKPYVKNASLQGVEEYMETDKTPKNILPFDDIEELDVD